MYTFRELSAEEIIPAYEKVFREAFPPEELKPLSSILDMRERGFYRVCGLFDGGNCLSYICLWQDGRYILIDYLCVPATMRNGGFGAKTIEKMLQSHPDNSIFIGEVEAPTGDPEADAMILRRLGFYDRCGAKIAGYDNAQFGVHYKTIYWANDPVDEGELMRRHDGFYRRYFKPEVYASSIQLPLLPGEKPFPRRAWTE